MWRKGDRRAHSILLDRAVNRLKGMVECAMPECKAIQVLFCTHLDEDAPACIEQHGEEITRFITEHACGPGPN